MIILKQKNKAPDEQALRAIFRRISVSDRDLAEKISIAGGKKVTQQAVNLWVQRKTVPASWAVVISRVSGGKIEPHELRPDVFPEPA